MTARIRPTWTELMDMEEGEALAVLRRLAPMSDRDVSAFIGGMTQAAKR